MKTLKFKSHLVPKVLSGEKTATWRLFDDKDLQTGDELELVNKDTGEHFANATITDVVEKKIGDLNSEELVEHGYQDVNSMLTSHRGYYGNRVGMETGMKIITFKLT